MISALILTKNEEADLGGALDSLNWCGDVHVFDSFSTDATVAVAKSRGAEVYQRAFDGYSSQRNAALSTARFKFPWVFILDADERIPDLLVTEIQRFVAAGAHDICAARIQRRDYFHGRWLKHAQISPYFIRLVRPAQVHYEREINEVLVPHGPVADLKGYFDHYPFSKGLVHWIDKHNRYSTMEAQRALAERHGIRFSLKKAVFARDFNERRFHQKGLYYRLPGRPAIKLLYMLGARRAFLDGRPGITYAFLQAIYEYFIVVKERELQARAGAGGGN